MLYCKSDRYWSVCYTLSILIYNATMKKIVKNGWRGGGIKYMYCWIAIIGADFLSIFENNAIPYNKILQCNKQVKNHLIIAGSSSYLEFILGIKSIIK